MKVSPIQTNFSGGEFSPRAFGRVDAERYRTGLEKSLNFYPTVQGGLLKRSGSMFVEEVKDSSKETRLVAFEFSVTQAYILEFGDEYIRFYRDNGQILDGLSAYEISSPYIEDDLFDLNFTQSADVLYITHPDYQPRELSRTGHTSWTLTSFINQDGPYLSESDSGLTLTPSAATGSGVTLSTGATTAITNAANNGSGLIRITSTSHGKQTGDKVGISGVVGTTEANGSWTVTRIDANNFDLQGSTFANAYVSGGTVFPYLFESTDVGRIIRLLEGATWGWVTITAFVNYGQVTVTVEETLTDTTSKSTWRLGVWSGTTGYPAVSTFHEDRLFFSGVPDFPQRIDASNTGDYENFAPSGLDGEIVDSNALSFTFNATDVNVVRWLISDEKGLIVGTVAGEWIVRPSATAEALTPTNINAKRSTNYGSSSVTALQSGKSAIFVQRAGRKIREVSFFFDVDGFRATDLTELGEHATLSGIKEMALQKEPQNIIWMVRNDGVLAGLTYERNLDGLRAGWHRHILGGVSNAADDSSVVESVAVIPSSDGFRDEVWVLVKRFIDGSTVRYIEYFTPEFDDEIEQKDCFFVDSGLTYDDPKTITAATKANPCVITSASHGFSNGDKVLISDVKGMTQLNGVSYLVDNATTDTFSLTDLQGDDIDSSAFDTYVSGGAARKYVTTISGITHLEGQEVALLADGATQARKTVSSGSITLTEAATTVHIGLSFMADGKLLRIDAGSGDGTSIGKTRRIHRVGFLVYRTLGLKIGPSFSDLTTLTFREGSDKMSRAIPLMSGIISETIEFDYDYENQLCFRSDDPLPCLINAIMPQMVTQDR